MDASSFIELLTPLFPHLFLPLASIANVGKNISFLAASASRAAAHRAFATHENLADITAKVGSQSILASMLGTGLGITVATAIGSVSGGDASLTYSMTLGAFAACSAINLAATYASLRNVTLTTLNPGRFDYLFSRWLTEKTLLSPREFASHEYLLGAPLIDGLPDLVIGPDLDQAAESSELLRQALAFYEAKSFVVTAQVEDIKGISSGGVARAQVNLLLKADAQEADVVEGLCTAYLVRRGLQREGYRGLSLQERAAPQSVQGATTWRSVHNIVVEDGGTPAAEKAQVAAFMRGLGFNLSPVPGADAIVDEDRHGGSSGGGARESSTVRNSYPTWHVETLLLEKRYARIEN
jgi:hypothetical protein